MKPSLLCAFIIVNVLFLPESKGQCVNERWSGGSLNLQVVSFSDSLHGIVIGSEYDSIGIKMLMLRSSDAGVSWEGPMAVDTVRMLRQPSLLDTTFLYAFQYFYQSQTWQLVARMYRLRIATNAWEILTEFSIGNIQGIAFCDSLHGLISGDSAILRTRDGGRSWERVFAASASFRPGTIAYPDSLHATAISQWGNTGGIFHTTDGGTHWYEQQNPSAVMFGDVSFFDTDVGFIVAYPSDSSTILRTTDGGEHWLPVRMSGGNYVSRVSSMSRMKAVTFLGNSVLLTSDGGASWEIAPVVPAPATLLNPFYLSSGDIVFTRWSYNGDQPRASILTLSADHCSTSVTLQSPANGASHLPLIIGQSTGPRQSLLFQWHGGGQILGREWRLQISSDTMFTSGSKVDTSMSHYPWISDYSVILPDFSISTTYYWKVVLKNIDGAISGGSETWHFSTAGGIISGRVYDDVNRNRQYDVGENPFSNSILQISGTMEGECRTDFAGIFFIKGIPSGSYNVKSVMSRPWRPSYTDADTRTVSMGEDDSMSGVDFGWYRPENLITGLVYKDLNRNGVRDLGEPGFPNQFIYLLGNSEQSFRTDTGGTFFVDHLDSGWYQMNVDADYPWVPSKPDTNVYIFHIGEYDTLTGLDFGWYYPTNSISGTVFHDVNENGLRDPDEPVMAGWYVHIHDSSQDDSSLTDSSGSYLFDHVPLGLSNVWISVEPSWEQISPKFNTGYGFPINRYETHLTAGNFAVHPIPVRTKILLTASEASGIFSRQVWFGVRAGATTGIARVDPDASVIDGSEGEVELPPRVTGSFDVRFKNPGIPTVLFGFGSWVDMRGLVSPTQVDTYRISYLIGTSFGGTYPLTFRWSPAQVAAAYDGPVRIGPADQTETNDFTDMKFTGGGSITISLGGVIDVLIIAEKPRLSATYWPGWNLVSLDAEPPTNVPSLLFPTAVSPPFFFSQHGSYGPAAMIEPGIGYWLNFSASSDGFASTGQPRPSDTLDLNEGWNLIGAVGVPRAVSDVATNPPGIRKSSFFGYNSNYFIADTLQPKHGYWVKVSQSGQMIIGPDSLKSMTKPVLQPLSNDAYSTLTFCDKDGRNGALYFTNGDVTEDALNFSELPPLPPAGAFDVRFASDRMIERLDRRLSRGSVPIRMSSVRFPLRVLWNVRPGMDGFSLAIDQRVVPLQGNGSTVLTEMPRLLELSFHNATELPAEFSLSQNYPNPFNPTTELSFTIGRLSLVTMKVYDVLGREVATIVNEELTLGRYSRSWDASKVPSGVYYVRMVATDRMGNQLYQNTRKLVLMK